MEKIFRQFTSVPRKTEYRPVNRYVSSITRQQALVDLDELIYLIDNRYCGREYWERKGIEFGKCYEKIRNYIEAQEEVYISDLCRKIHEAFNVGIVDNHFSFASPFTGLMRFSKQFAAYFTDFLVEQREDKYVVIKSETDTVTVGECISDFDCLYPTLAPKGVKRYLVGCRSYAPVQGMDIAVNGSMRHVPVHRCRAGVKTESNDICLAWKQIQGIDVLRSNCCDYVGGLTETTDYVAIGKKYRETDNLVLNYLSNEGGYNRITREFFKGLNDYVHCQEYSMKLISPVTENCDCERKWVPVSSSEPYELEKGFYRGTVYMLVNNETASAGETAVLYGRSLKNFVLVGENTMGCNMFGNVDGYELKHSRIICRIPNVINLCANPGDCEEGKGFEPDYWVDSFDVEEEVLDWIKQIK